MPLLLHLSTNTIVFISQLAYLSFVCPPWLSLVVTEKNYVRAQKLSNVSLQFTEVCTKSIEHSRNIGWVKLPGECA